MPGPQLPLYAGGRADARGLPGRAAGQGPGAEHRAHVVRRRGLLRPERRPRRDARRRRAGRSASPTRSPSCWRRCGDAGRVRRGLVLGAGGVLGAAWTIGALDALAEVEGFDPHEADVIVGTSAGSVLAALLGAGVTAPDLRDHQRGLPLPRRARRRLGLRPLDRRRAARPGRGSAVGSPALLRRSLTRPRQVPPLAVLAALPPPGTRHAGRGRPRWSARSPARTAGRRATASGSSRWTTTPGERVAFGRAGRAAGHARRGGHGVVRDPRLVRAGARSAAAATSTAARCSATSVDLLARLRPGRGLRARADGVLRRPTSPRRLAGPARAPAAPAGHPAAARARRQSVEPGRHRRDRARPGARGPRRRSAPT